MAETSGLVAYLLSQWTWPELLTPRTCCTTGLSSEESRRVCGIINALASKNVDLTLVDSMGQTLLYIVSTYCSSWCSYEVIITTVFRHHKGVNLSYMRGSDWTPLCALLNISEESTWVSITKEYLDKDGPLDNPKPEADHVLCVLSRLRYNKVCNLMDVFDLLIPLVGGYPMRGLRGVRDPFAAHKISRVLMRWSVARVAWLGAVVAMGTREE